LRGGKELEHSDRRGRVEANSSKPLPRRAAYDFEYRAHGIDARNHGVLAGKVVLSACLMTAFSGRIRRSGAEVDRSAAL
jgi:hypothetical protein